MTERRFKTMFIVVCTALLLPLLFPLYALGNRAEPIVLGLPFSFFWVLLFVVLVAIAVVGMYFLDPDLKSNDRREAHDG